MNMPFQHKNLIPSVKHEDGSIMGLFWPTSGPGRLTIIDGTNERGKVGHAARQQAQAHKTHSYLRVVQKE